MPTYQYACTECGHRFEAVQAFTDDSLTVCPVCSGPLRKVYGSVGVVFKGSGFYRTDSRAGALTAANGSADKSAGEKSGEKKAEKAGGEKKAAATADSGSKPSSSGSTSSSGGSSSTGSSGSSGSSKAAAG